ncbi:hypothetical protein [uncultured Alistipes sp.]|uniref:hypothetical protein n=1 Tax=uncultured Alistipes sp. TaxID=538949 RepID=UPI0025F8F159|nr:hypothetical protein [uncultured Alistipes sp.]
MKDDLKLIKAALVVLLKRIEVIEVELRKRNHRTAPLSEYAAELEAEARKILDHLQ